MDDDVKVVIETRENGPLVVKGLDELTGPDGQPLEVKPVVALCRCGGSKTKPFCDGSHKTNGFQSSGGTPSGVNRILRYAGEEVTVTYNPLICSHAAVCGRVAPDVFNPNQKPWVQPDKGSRNAVESVIAHCPSGALALALGDTVTHLVADRARIEVARDGPYYVREAEIAEPHPGQGACHRKFVLCRCGKSGIKPYCDGSHRDADWKSGD
ncbi:CDGSH iron-sulfur domain-containing protein [Defluviimonas aestuarii]|uniref:CDGSH iron-sulfur domain-containing protein n=1 Tax=Albidovulum aestuarii TaxID=1130726 RepID=UPI00249A8B9E|nr:CDGSH iron-sulfur domain-containing protein [Defluviimonas aestuarii]MDI3337656.1 CDGSH iron-sulfur domain-containing protein [Defluviimonas aestuarii]